MDAKELETRMLAASATANDLHGHFSRTRDWELAYASALVGEAKKDAAAWRALVVSADGGHVHVVGCLDIPQPARSIAYEFKAPVPEYVSIEHVPVKQAVFRWFGDESLRDALLATVPKNDHPQKS